MNPSSPSAKLLLAVLAIWSGFLAIVSFILSYALGDVVGLLFSYRPTVWIIVALLVWFAVAWTARRIWVGDAKKLRFRGRWTTAWVLLKIGFLLGVGVLLLGWLTGLATGWFLATVFVRAAVLLIEVNFVFGIIGGATINSLLALRRTLLVATL